jgi:DNA polymerase III subunit epsilon
LLFAIVDIETTGGNPEKDKIIEVAIILHDGYNVLKSYHTLVNPKVKIPFHIYQLTGITDEMLKNAPEFHEVAREIIAFTDNAIFVAHNVRFDYSFIKSAYKNLGYIYQRKTLCTVRLSRQVFKNEGSYSLGKLCESLRINIKNRHRAMGDARATAELFSKISYELSLKDKDWVKSALGYSNIPPLLDEQKLNEIPEQFTGVYYFYNSLNEIIYIGKANDVKKRIE